MNFVNSSLADSEHTYILITHTLTLFPFHVRVLKRTWNRPSRICIENENTVELNFFFSIGLQYFHSEKISL